jgi:hypothetical protein
MCSRERTYRREKAEILARFWDVWQRKKLESVIHDLCLATREQRA